MNEQECGPSCLCLSWTRYSSSRPFRSPRHWTYVELWNYSIGLYRHPKRVVWALFRHVISRSRVADATFGVSDSVFQDGFAELTELRSSAKNVDSAFDR